MSLDDMYPASSSQELEAALFLQLGDSWVADCVKEDAEDRMGLLRKRLVGDHAREAMPGAALLGVQVLTGGAGTERQGSSSR